MAYNGPIAPSTQFTLVPDVTDLCQRIDIYLTKQFLHYSRTFFQKLVESGSISRNGVVIIKPSTLVYPDDKINIIFPGERVVAEQEVMNITTNVSIVAKTDHFMIIYKPAGLLVHAPSKTSSAITLTDWILHHHTDLAHVGIVDRPGIVHRLDKDTSGIMIITRTNHAHSVFNTLFKERNIKKEYIAIVEGHPDRQGTISMGIGRDPFNRIKMKAFSDDEDCASLSKRHSIKIRHALTDYTVLQYFKDTTLIKVKPTTGRTHQIRVHMAAIGHPIVGDATYGSTSSLINRQALHAHGLSFAFDDNEYSFTQDVPEDMQLVISKLSEMC